MGGQTPTIWMFRSKEGVCRLGVITQREKNSNRGGTFVTFNFPIQGGGKGTEDEGEPGERWENKKSMHKQGEQ